MKKTFKVKVLVMLVIVFLLSSGLKSNLTNTIEPALTPAQEFEQLQPFLNFVNLNSINTNIRTNADNIGLKEGVKVAKLDVSGLINLESLDYDYSNNVNIINLPKTIKLYEYGSNIK